MYPLRTSFGRVECVALSCPVRFEIKRYAPKGLNKIAQGIALDGETPPKTAP